MFIGAVSEEPWNLKTYTEDPQGKWDELPQKVSGTQSARADDSRLPGIPR